MQYYPSWVILSLIPSLIPMPGAPKVKDKAKLAEPIKVNEGEDLVLKVPFSGKPKPKVSVCYCYPWRELFFNVFSWYNIVNHVCFTISTFFIEIQVKWFKGSEELKSSPKYNMEVTPRTAVLTVKGAEKEDEFAYRAELENDLGKDKADMKAEVVEKEGRTILSLLYRITWKTETKM